MMLKQIEPKIWQGRIDSVVDKDAFRWHQNINLNSNQAGLSLLGFECDIGVMRNKGRVGAKAAPNLIKAQLANLPSHSELQQNIFDAGNVSCVDDALENAQAELAKHTSDLLAKNLRHINLGGGHEIAWASFLGMANYAEKLDKTPKIGIINFDAHFDIRPADEASSGTPFAQAAEHCKKNGWPFNYCALGISETGNTKALFKTADGLGVNYRLDRHMSLQHLADAKKQLSDFMQKVDYIYVTVDLDAFPAGVAPGVSAPATRGISLEIVEPLVKQIVASGKLKLADIAEYNPKYDIDNRTAKLAARLVFLLSK